MAQPRYLFRFLSRFLSRFWSRLRSYFAGTAPAPDDAGGVAGATGASGTAAAAELAAAAAAAIGALAADGICAAPMAGPLAAGADEAGRSSTLPLDEEPERSLDV